MLITWSQWLNWTLTTQARSYHCHHCANVHSSCTVKQTGNVLKEQCVVELESSDMNWYTITMSIYSLALYHKAKLCFILRFISEYVKKLQLLNSQAVALHLMAMSTLLPCTHQRFLLNLCRTHNQSAQYAWLGQWAVSPFEGVDAFDRCAVDPPDCG